MIRVAAGRSPRLSSMPQPSGPPAEPAPLAPSVCPWPAEQAAREDSLLQVLRSTAPQALSFLSLPKYFPTSTVPYPTCCRAGNGSPATLIGKPLLTCRLACSSKNTQFGNRPPPISLALRANVAPPLGPADHSGTFAGTFGKHPPLPGLATGRGPAFRFAGNAPSLLATARTPLLASSGKTPRNPNTPESPAWCWPSRPP